MGNTGNTMPWVSGTASYASAAATDRRRSGTSRAAVLAFAPVLRY